MPIFSRESLRQTLGSKGLGSNVNKVLQSSAGTKNTSTAKGQFIKSLAGKTNQQREKVYKQFGLNQSGRKQIEGTIDEGRKTYTKEESIKIHRAEESKKKLNIFLSKRSGEESSGGGSGYQSSTGHFAGGAVQTRSRVGSLGSGEKESDNVLDLGKKKIGGFALGEVSGTGSGFALGKASGEKKGFALANGESKNKNDNGDENKPIRPSGLNFGGGI